MSTKDKAILRVELVVVTAIQILLIVVVITATFVLYVLLAKNLLSHATRIESASEVLPVMQQAFAGVLTVVLGLELLETLKTYFAEQHIRLEVILVVAIIAVARHLLQLDLEHTSATVLIGLAAVIIALTSGYFLIKKTHYRQNGDKERSE